MLELSALSFYILVVQYFAVEVAKYSSYAFIGSGVLRVSVA